MDMQVKLKFTIGYYNSDNKKEEIKYIDEENYPDGKLGSTFISFEEYNYVTVDFEGADGDILNIQTYDCDSVKNVKSGETAVISSGRDKDDMLVPGFYSIAVETSNRTYCGFFMVEPASLSWNGLISMRKYLEKTVYGLSRNLYSRKVMDSKNSASYNFAFTDIYGYIKENESTIINNLKSIVSNPKTDITKAYKLCHGAQKRCDFKSQRWYLTKGININQSSYAADMALEVHAALNLNINENKWIRKIIHHTIVCLCKIENDYKIVLDEMLKQYEEKNAKYKKTLIKYNKIANDITIADNLKNVIKKRAGGILGKSSKINDEVDYIKEIIEDIKKFRTILSYYEYETWISEVKEYEKIQKPSIGMVKDFRYLTLYEYYEKLKDIETGNGSSKNNLFSFKRTSKLFEYYIVVMIIQMIQKSGYEWEKGWLADSISLKTFNADLPSESVMYFRKSNILCEIAYDLEIENESSDGGACSFVRNNTRNYRPDIRVAILNLDTGKLLHSIIIEVKCRKARYIYNENADTPVIAQLNDYYNLGYKYTEEKYITRGVIDSVILVYPKQESKVNYNGACNYSFIQVEPAEDLESAYGYDELKKAICSYL